MISFSQQATVLIIALVSFPGIAVARGVEIVRREVPIVRREVPLEKKAAIAIKDKKMELVAPEEASMIIAQQIVAETNSRPPREGKEQTLSVDESVVISRRDKNEVEIQKASSVVVQPGEVLLPEKKNVAIVSVKSAPVVYRRRESPLIEKKSIAVTAHASLEREKGKAVALCEPEKKVIERKTVAINQPQELLIGKKESATVVQTAVGVTPSSKCVPLYGHASSKEITPKSAIQVARVAHHAYPLPYSSAQAMAEKTEALQDEEIVISENDTEIEKQEIQLLTKNEQVSDEGSNLDLEKRIARAQCEATERGNERLQRTLDFAERMWGSRNKK